MEAIEVVEVGAGIEGEVILRRGAEAEKEREVQVAVRIKEGANQRETENQYLEIENRDHEK